MNRKQLCEALEVTPCTTFNWQRQRGFPKKKVNLKGTSWRWDFDEAKVRAWLRQKKRE